MTLNFSLSTAYVDDYSFFQRNSQRKVHHKRIRGILRPIPRERFEDGFFCFKILKSTII